MVSAETACEVLHKAFPRKRRGRGNVVAAADALEASVSALACRDRQACMGKIVVSAERVVDAPADTVYRYVADMRDHHPRYLPPAFSDFRVESGGTGAGTITRFTVTAGGRTREYRMKVDEPEPGRVLTESDTGSSLVTTTTVSPRDSNSLVQIRTTWNGAGGIGGFFERRFAPRVMQAIYADELERLNAYAREQRPG
jgi:uncharacterized membrane protein